MRFGVLGRLEVYAEDGTVVDVGGPRPRLIIAALVAADGRPLGADALIEIIWGDEPPSAPAGALQTYISRLRRHVGADTLAYEAPGYQLIVPPAEVDAWRFEHLADEDSAALESGDPGRARASLAEGEALWHSGALSELVDVDRFRGVASRLEERRLVAPRTASRPSWLWDATSPSSASLAETVIAQPYREVLRAQLALALYRGGRRADALRSIARARATFGEELGIDLGADLRRLEAAILAHDPSLDLAPGRGARLGRNIPPTAA